MNDLDRAFDLAGIMEARDLLVRCEWFTRNQVEAMSDKQVWHEVFKERPNIMKDFLAGKQP